MVELLDGECYTVTSNNRKVTLFGEEVQADR